MTAGAINVPLHAPLTGRQIQFQLGETETRFLFVSTPAQLEKIKQVVDELPVVEGSDTDGRRETALLPRSRRSAGKWL